MALLSEEAIPIGGLVGLACSVIPSKGHVGGARDLRRRPELALPPGAAALLTSPPEGFSIGVGSNLMQVNFNRRQPATDDMDCVRGMLAGDAGAFETFFADQFPRLFRFALSRLGGNEDAAEDVVQLTLSKAVRKLATFRGEASLFTWLCTFCRHEISADYQRRGKEEVLMPEDISEIKQALEILEAPDEEQPENRLRRKETAQQVHLVLDRLPARYGDALEWKYVEGLSVLEIAERLRVGTKAAESLLTRARSAFRQMFSNVTLLSNRPQVGPGSKE